MSNSSTQDTQQLVESRWKSIRSAIRGRWPAISNEEIKMIGGDSRKLVALINQKTDMPLSEIEQAIDEIAASSGGLMQRVMQSASTFAKSAGKQVAQPVGQAYQQASQQVGQAYQQASQQVGQAYDQVQRQAGQAYDQARQQVVHHPGISLSTAFCTGMLIGVCLAALHRN